MGKSQSPKHGPASSRVMRVRHTSFSSESRKYYGPFWEFAVLGVRRFEEESGCMTRTCLLRFRGLGLSTFHVSGVDWSGEQSTVNRSLFTAHSPTNCPKEGSGCKSHHPDHGNPTSKMLGGHTAWKDRATFWSHDRAGDRIGSWHPWGLDFDLEGRVDSRPGRTVLRSPCEILVIPTTGPGISGFSPLPTSQCR